MIRSLLDRDRAWAVYALGDLDPRRAGFCEWHHSSNAVLLLYREFAVPILMTAGDPGEVAGLIRHAGPPPEAYLHIRPEVLPIIRSLYSEVRTKDMIRMALRNSAERPSPPSRDPVLLTRAEVPELLELYRDGGSCGEAPDFFFSSMLDDGTFFGIRENGRLLSAAGTHLVAPSEGVAAIGNIYTLRAARGRGLASGATAAVVAELRRRGITDIALSVRRDNPAIRVYERLGFVSHCAFVEGYAAGVLS